jgi:hypothetical protein
MFGTKIEWNDAFNDAYEKVYDDMDTPHVVLDSMSGEYMVLGEMLWNGGDIRWGLEDGEQAKSIDINSLSSIENNYKESFCKKFPNFTHFMDAPFMIQTFLHYS